MKFCVDVDDDVDDDVYHLSTMTYCIVFTITNSTMIYDSLIISYLC